MWEQMTVLFLLFQLLLLSAREIYYGAQLDARQLEFRQLANTVSKWLDLPLNCVKWNISCQPVVPNRRNVKKLPSDLWCCKVKIARIKRIKPIRAHLLSLREYFDHWHRIKTLNRVSTKIIGVIYKHFNVPFVIRVAAVQDSNSLTTFNGIPKSCKRRKTNFIISERFSLLSGAECIVTCPSMDSIISAAFFALNVSTQYSAFETIKIIFRLHQCSVS